VKDITIANICFGVADGDGKVGYVPLGPLYVTAALEQAGYNVDFRDYLVGSSAYTDPMAPQSLVAFLRDSCRLVGIGCTSGTLPLVLSAVEMLKRERPEMIVFLGGIGPTGVAEEIIREFPSVDVVVKGEGELTVVELTERLLAGSGLEGVRGIVYRLDSRVKDGGRRCLIEDLDDVPTPAYGKVNPHSYSIAGIASSRGCPYDCLFCDTAPFWQRRHRSRSLDDVLGEIRFLKETYGIRDFEFVDDTFVLNRSRVIEFCRRLALEPLDITWSCCGRIDLMDEEMMRTMAVSGCRMVFYGMESGSDRVLAGIKKKFTRKQACAVIARSARYFDVYVSFIWGFPFETMADFQETVDCTTFVSELGGTPWLFALAPLPMSSLYRQYRDSLELQDGWYSNMGGDREGAARVIRKYPGVFSGFYRYPTEAFDEKFALIKERGLMGDGEQTVFLDGLLVSKWT
jgi:radical SAM superfamily enzyme YgiQ (UPF0313 family)